MNWKTILVEADYHCGSRVGLTPKEYRSLEWRDEENLELRNFYIMQKEIYEWRKKILKEIGKVDIHFILGDCIDGRGEKSGGSEILRPVETQVIMATECIQEVGADKIYMVRGTPYHTGKNSDKEDGIARNVKAEIGNHLFVDVNGLIFDLKHKIGGSGSPVGRSTAMERAHVDNVLWHNDTNKIQPKSDILLRAHCHFYRSVEATHWRVIRCPPTSGMGSKFGEKECSAIVEIGMIIIKVNDKGGYECDPRILEAEFLKARILKA